jgi:hypothetical protein
LINEEEHFVVIKLVSGEQVMAILEEETEDEVDIVFPMLIRLFPIVDGANSREHVTATPYSQFADDAHLTISKHNILFLKNLNPAMVPHYLRLVEQENDKVFVKKDIAGNDTEKTSLGWEDRADEETEKKMKLLKYLTEENSPVTVIEGNDTKH